MKDEELPILSYFWLKYQRQIIYKAEPVGFLEGPGGCAEPTGGAGRVLTVALSFLSSCCALKFMLDSLVELL